jgi:hypothetical protein
MALLSRSTINQVKSELEKKKTEGVKYDKRPIIEAGECILTFINCEIKTTKKTGDAMLVFEWQKDDKHKPLIEYYVIEGSGRGPEINMQKIIELMYKGFNYEFQEAEKPEHLLSQIIQFKGKRVKAAIKHTEELFSSTDPVSGNKKMTIIRKPSLWYVGAESDNDFYVNINKTVKPLSLADKEAYIENSANASSESDVTPNDDMPF